MTKLLESVFRRKTSQDTLKIRTIDYRDGVLYLLDQTLLPRVEKIRKYTSQKPIAEAISSMVVRGAPAIGVTAALGIAIGLKRMAPKTVDAFHQCLADLSELFRHTRPTAVNLFWAIDQINELVNQHPQDTASTLVDRVEKLAVEMMENDMSINQKIGKSGANLVKDSATILTHCNAGALATVAYGTALSVIRHAHWEGKSVQVIADETRPRLQGGHLTAWEMVQEGIPCQVISDNMAGHFMAQGKIDMVIVGADRIAANGDTANKIGTYSLAILAYTHNIPFYVAAPFSTFDYATPSGTDIPIEERDPTELSHVGGHAIYPEGVQLVNPAFDVTPLRYIYGFITEYGVVLDPSELLQFRKDDQKDTPE